MEYLEINPLFGAVFKTYKKATGCLNIKLSKYLFTVFLILGDFPSETEDLNFRDILSHDYYNDDQWLWLNNKKRVSLREKVTKIDEKEFDVETVLRVLEVSVNGQPYNVYDKERVKNYPEVQQVQEDHYEKLTVMYKKGELRISIQVQSVELMLKNYLDAYRKLASFK